MRKKVALSAILFLSLTFIFTQVLPASEKKAAKKSPVSMENSSIDDLVLAGAGLLDDDANWTDQTKGRKIYDDLKNKDGQLVTDSLVRMVLKNKNRLRVLFLGVKLGIQGSEKKLNETLLNHGDKRMAEDFLNSGSSDLYEGGRKWGAANGYYIETGDGSNRVGWGSF